MPDAPYRLIPLRRRDGTVQAYAIVDPEDFDRLGHLRWCRDSSGYVIRCMGPRGACRTVFLHRTILGITDPRLQVDHVDGDLLDNRRCKLRPATSDQRPAARTSRTRLV